MSRACVIGSGPNGLAAAIVLAQAGLSVDVFEAEAEAGGAVRTMPLTLPGFLHDFGSAVYPFAAGSPFFATLPLADHGLEWIHGEAPLAHPLDDGSAVVLERDLGQAERALGADGKLWRGLMQPAADDWMDFAEDALGPALRIPHHPLRMARFGLSAIQSAQGFAQSHFAGPRTRAVFAGLAGHSFLSFDQPLSATIGLMFGITIHAVGWPIPRGGAQAITRGADRLLEDAWRNGAHFVHASMRLRSASWRRRTILCSSTPRRGNWLRSPATGFRPDTRRAERFQRAPGAFKIDYALSQPVPWRAADCRRAITVHLGGTFEEIAEVGIRGRAGARSRAAFRAGCAAHAFRSDRARRRASTCCGPIVTCPTARTFDMTERIEAQIERFAPGFRDCVLARHVSTPRRSKRWMRILPAATSAAAR